MEIVADIIKIFVPAGLVLYGMYATSQAFLQKQFDEITQLKKMDDNQIVLPIKLQAFERMALYLERISPNNLILRLPSFGMLVEDYQQILIKEIRDEFNHNLAQQIYFSEEVWGEIKFATDELLSKINGFSKNLGAEKNAVELAKLLINEYSTEQMNSIQIAMKSLKKEIQKKFN